MSPGYKAAVIGAQPATPHAHESRFPVGLAFVDTPIWIIAVVIGVCTFTMVSIGIMLGHLIGRLVAKWAEALGGLILIAVGAAVLYEHLSAA